MFRNNGHGGASGSAEEAREAPARSRQTTPEAGHLVLVGEPRSRVRVAWTDDTIDNENLNRKKSKVCCIFHPPTEFGESSEEDSISESDYSSSGSESGSGSDVASNGRNRPHNGRPCTHKHRESRPNAYERQPRVNRRPQS